MAALFLLGFAIVNLLHQSRHSAIDVLRPAIYFSLLAVSGWFAASLMSLSLFKLRTENSALMDQFWYWTAVFSCCPLISILGARRPTARIWTGFIIVPLIAVLGWPAVTSLAQFPQITELVIQLPVFIGFILVLVMGVGNYMGTRYGLSAAIGGIAVMISLWPLSNLFGGDASLAGYWRAIAALLFGVGILHGFRQAARPILVDSNFDLLWFDFCDSFGIVWSIRIQDRINQVAVKEKWAVRLGTEGFDWRSDVSQEEQRHTAQRLNETLRWLFRRFVENEWIDQRLNRSSATTETES